MLKNFFPYKILSLGNKFLTFLSNVFTDLNLTDIETCYKVFKKEHVDKIRIKKNLPGKRINSIEVLVKIENSN